MDESTLKVVMKANIVDENKWRIVDPNSKVLFRYASGIHSMMIPSHSTPFEMRDLASIITWELVENTAIGQDSPSIILHFPSYDSDRLSPFLLEVIEAAGNSSLSSKIIQEIAKEWESLWKKRSRLLSAQQQRGLFAELIVLENLILSEGNDAIEMWHGPIGGLHDFVLGSRFIEVKAQGKISKIISVSSIDQLQPQTDSDLFLCCLTISRTEDGLTLKQLVQRIYDSVSTESQSNFVKKLKSVNYKVEDGEFYPGKYEVTQRGMMKITEDSNTFHRRKLKSQNPGLLDAIYKLDTSYLNLIPITDEVQFASFSQ
ncbi:PD-(D/E)XK motif protein [Candidatus Poseidoniales archaeon]|nr:PD-(D/E)XK motif protein [Candidatus Poseidoniales archaeon]